MFAEDLYHTDRYTVTFTVATNIIDQATSNIKLYPNPTMGVLNIGTDTEAEIYIYATDGSLVGNFSMIHNKRIDLSHLSNGIYFVKVKSEDQVVTRKVSLNK